MGEPNSAGDFRASEPLGRVLSVRGSVAQVDLPAPAASELRRATVGAFVRIWVGARRLVGMIVEVEGRRTSEGASADLSAVAKIDLMGEIAADDRGVERFVRGVSTYPAIGDPADLLGREDLRLIYAEGRNGDVTIGSLYSETSIPARISIDNTISKHFAILGSTGVGKSSGVAVLLAEILEARPNLRIFLLDSHNEFGRSFGARANLVNATNLKLPFWLFNFEEFVDVLYGGRPGVEEEMDILAEHIPVAKGMYLMHKIAQDRGGLRRIDPRRAGYTVDTPVPYLLQDLTNLIDERMGKLENRATRMHYHRLIARIETLRTDSRYSFMFENANVGGDTMSEILTHLFRLEPGGPMMTVMQVAGLPVEVVDAVACVVTRLAFDFGLWSDGATPMLFVCEEAHRFAPADPSVGFAPTRRALLRIAKEGRKYGVYLGVVTQRPAELDSTLISQCNTIFAMRMANDRDQALLRSAVSDAVANLLAFVPSLGTREVVAFGEGVPIPARLIFKALPLERIPHSETFERGDLDGEFGHDRSFVKLVVERWRGATGAARAAMSDSASPSASPDAAYASPHHMPLAAPPLDPQEAEGESRPKANPVASRIDLIRAQILMRGGTSGGGV